MALFAVCARHRGRERRHDRHEQGLGDEPSETLFPHPEFPTALGFTKSPPVINKLVKKEVITPVVPRCFLRRYSVKVSLHPYTQVKHD